MKRIFANLGKAALVGIACAAALTACNIDINVKHPETPDKFGLYQSDYEKHQISVKYPHDIARATKQVYALGDTPNPKFLELCTVSNKLEFDDVVDLRDFTSVWRGQDRGGIKYMYMSGTGNRTVKVKIDFSGFHARTVHYYYPAQQQQEDQNTTGLDIHRIIFSELEKLENEGFEINVIDGEMPEYTNIPGRTTTSTQGKGPR